MSFGKRVRSFFTGANPQKSESNSGQDRWGTANIPAISRDMPVEVRDHDTGKMLFSARLGTFNLDNIVLERLPGTFSIPNLANDNLVQVRGYDKGLEPINISAKVVESNCIVCKLSNLRLMSSGPKRSATRLPLLNTEGQLFMAGDTWMARPFPCKVMDISETGAMVISEYCIPDDLPIRLRVELAKGTGASTFRSQIIRAEILDDEKFEYGLLFAQLDQRQQRDLARDMEDAQDQIRKLLNRQN